MSVFGRWFKKGEDKPAASPAAGAPPAGPAAAEAAATVTLSQAIEIAVGHHQSGRYREAEHVYLQVLSVDPANFDALHLLGVVAHQQGDHQRAIDLISKAVSVSGSNAVAYNNLGESYRALGRNRDAEACYEKSLALGDHYAEPAYNLGNLFRGEGRLEQARASYEQAVAAQPEFAEAHYNLGNVFKDQGEADAAAGCYRKVLALRPGFAECHLSLGNVLKDRGELEEAGACYGRALALQPQFVAALVNLGNVLREQGKTAEAKAHYEKAGSLNPGFADAHVNLAHVLRELGDAEKAQSCYEKALELQPDAADVLFGLGNALVDQGRHEEALANYQKALALDPEYVEARWAHAMAQLPAVYGTDVDPGRARAAFAAELAALETWFDSSRSARGFKAVGVLQPFLLAYQEESNRDLLARYGNLCARLMRSWQESQPSRAAPRSKRDKIVVGIVSAQIFDHSVWNTILKGCFLHLDRARFDLEVFYLGSTADQETSFARSRASHFEYGRKSLSQWVDSIAGRNPDVLIYPEIGMDPMTVKLASLRLAPVQMASWGHPETTGLPTIDYYLSAELLEPPHAQEQYTEQLVALPNLGCTYQVFQGVPVAPDLGRFGLDVQVPLLLCPGVPFKYAPSKDEALIEIARRLKRCKFVFFTYRLAGLSERLRQRLRAAFERAGLSADDFIVFIPWQSKPMFYGLMGRADVFLDTIGFSGFNTAMQAVESGLPIVTREGRFMRGRFASGILKRMGLAELVAESESAYVETAVKLVRDNAYRQDVRRRIEAGRDMLYDDPAPVRALEEFLLKVCPRG